MNDPGVQAERTALAWRRTGLALAVAALLVIRVLFGFLGVAAAVVGMTVIVIAATAFALSHRRYRVHHAHLNARGGGSDAALLAVTGCCALALAVAALVAVSLSV